MAPSASWEVPRIPDFTKNERRQMDSIIEEIAQRMGGSDERSCFRSGANFVLDHCRKNAETMYDAEDEGFVAVQYVKLSDIEALFAERDEEAATGAL